MLSLNFRYDKILGYFDNTHGLYFNNLLSELERRYL